MKRSILLFTAAASLGYFTLTSYQSGPAAQGEGNRTGSGGNATCSGGSCHGANNTSTTIQIFLTETATGTQVTNGKYKPQTSYTVILGGGNSAGATRYGFQLTAVNGTNTDAGAFTASGNLHTVKNSSTGNITVVEHSVGISGAATFNVPSFVWVSPVAGSGTVTFHAIVNATNASGTADNGDHASTATFVFTEQANAVSDLSENIRITAYPNPVASQMSLKFEDAEIGNYTVIVSDLSGKVLCQQNLDVKNTQAQMYLDASGWASGMYLTTIFKDGAQRVLPVVKQ